MNNQVKIERLQQEILIVDGKKVCVEAGMVGNGYDFTPKQRAEIINFLARDVRRVSNKLISNMLNQ